MARKRRCRKEEDPRDTNGYGTQEVARKGREKGGWDPMGIAETGGKTEEDSRENEAGGTARVTRGTDQVRGRLGAVRAPAEGTER